MKYPTRLNGKPLSHWQREATKAVIEILVRGASIGEGQHASIIGNIARQRLLELAEAEDPELFKAVLQERDTCRAGLTRMMAAMLPAKVRRKSEGSKAG